MRPRRTWPVPPVPPVPLPVRPQRARADARLETELTLGERTALASACAPVLRMHRQFLPGPGWRVWAWTRETPPMMALTRHRQLRPLRGLERTAWMTVRGVLRRQERTLPAVPAFGETPGATPVWPEPATGCGLELQVPAGLTRAFPPLPAAWLATAAPRQAAVRMAALQQVPAVQPQVSQPKEQLPSRPREWRASLPRVRLRSLRSACLQRQFELCRRTRNSAREFRTPEPWPDLPERHSGTRDS